MEYVKEVVELLTNRKGRCPDLWHPCAKMKPIGQIQAAERMIHANAYSTRMARKALSDDYKSLELLVTP